jgi:flagellar basal-body rod modification protein FlgD
MPDTSASFLNSVQVPRAATTPRAPAVTTDKTKQLGKQDFLKLLMAQLQNQNPMKPMDDTQMIAQMAQFSALEAMQTLNATLQKSSNVQTVAQTAALIGKYIQADEADGTTTMGMVTDVHFTSTEGVIAPTLSVDGKDVDYSKIRQVSSSPIASAQG